MPKNPSNKRSAIAAVPTLPDVEAKRPPWLDDLIKLSFECRQRILVVADGGLNFSAASAFGLTQLIAALTSGAAGFMPVTITTAHRGLGAGATHTNFRFDAPPVPLTRDNFDQLWLFGIASGLVGGTFQNNPNAGAYNPNLGINDAEVRAIAAFMQAGGGVFATGDHASLGRAMCGRLPRIRQMRNWESVPMGLEPDTGPDGRITTALRRIDTLADPMSNADYEFDDQSDTLPQRLYPHYRQLSAGATFTPHPLLSSPARVIDVFPDHPHESECLTASSPAATYTEASLNFAEFPAAGASRPVPELAASSMSGGRFMRTNSGNAAIGKPPVIPRSFGAISAYDGDAVSRGRVVCDSTWHHFVNVNLDGTGTPFLPGLGSVRTGFTTVPNVYDQVKRYYSNIARWLAPLGRRRCWLMLEIIVIRFEGLLLEELPPPIPLPDPPPWPLLRDLGATARAALASRVGEASADEAINDLVLDPEVAPRANALLLKEPLQSGLVDLDAVRLAAFGAVMHRLVSEWPQDPNELVKDLGGKAWHRLVDQTLPKLARQAIEQVLVEVVKAARADLKRLEVLGVKRAG